MVLFTSVRVVECYNLPEVVDATSHHVDSVDFLDCERGVARENQEKNKQKNQHRFLEIEIDEKFFRDKMI